MKIIRTLYYTNSWILKSLLKWNNPVVIVEKVLDNLSTITSIMEGIYFEGSTNLLLKLIDYHIQETDYKKLTIYGDIHFEKPFGKDVDDVGVVISFSSVRTVNRINKILSAITWDDLEDSVKKLDEEHALLVEKNKSPYEYLFDDLKEFYRKSSSSGKVIFSIQSWDL